MSRWSKAIRLTDVLPLRYTRGWSVAGIMMLAFVFAAMVMPALLPDVSIRTLFELDKWLHGITFLVLAVWFSGQYTRRFYWRIAAGLLVFGGFIELVQRSLTYRSGDLADLLANVVGISAGLTIALAGLGGWSLRVESWLASRQLQD